MELSTIAPLIRMAERSLIVMGGILSIYLGYKLFITGIDKPQGGATFFGIELKNFGPGLFFAALGAVILVTTMKAAIRVDERPSTSPANTVSATAPAAETSVASTTLFFGLEDPSRQMRKWAPLSFFSETRLILRRLDKGESADQMEGQRKILEAKLESITMSAPEYERYQVLIGQVPLSENEQAELLELQGKLVP